MKCAVVGAAGFIGANLCLELLRNGYSVRGIDRPEVQPRLTLPAGGIEWREADIVTGRGLVDALRSCDVVFHLASSSVPQSSNEFPFEDMESNVGGALKLLEAGRVAGVEKFIFSSSGGTVYGMPVTIPIHEAHPTDPICAYGVSKLAIEKYFSLYQSLHGVKSLVLRVANPYGPGQSPYRSQGAIGVFLQRALAKQTIEIWGDGGVVRDYLFVTDVCAAFVRALEYRGEQKTFNVGSGKGYSINEILDAIESAVGRSVARNYLPGRRFDVPSNVLCTERARFELGWTPKMGLQDGILKTLEWLRSTSRLS